MRNERGIRGAITALHAAVGTWVATTVPGPLLSADDLAYLGMARTLAGEGAAPLAPQPPYGVLYPVMLAPGWALGLDEVAMLTWARSVNALLGALLVPVLFLLVRRLTGAGFRWSLAAAVVGASLPALFATGSIVWTERLLALLVAGALLALCRAHEEPSMGRVASTVALAVAMFASHPRLGLATVVIIAGSIYMARARREIAAAAAGLGFTGILAAEGARRLLATASFDDSGTYDVGDLASRRGFDDAFDMVLRAGGTVAYLVLATAGIAVVGLVVLGRNRVIGPWALATLAAVIVVAGWFLTGVDRADAHLHGRYIEVYAPIAVALGVIGMRELGSRFVAALLVGPPIIAGLYGAWAGPGNNWNQSRSPVMMLGTEAGGAPFGNDVFEPGAAALVALVVGGLFLATVRQREPWLFLVVALPVLALGIASSLEAVDQLYDGAVAGEVSEGLEGVEIDQIVIVGAVAPNLGGAVAWEVGIDSASTEIRPETSHLLLPVDAIPPPGAEMAVAFAGGTIWQLR